MRKLLLLLTLSCSSAAFIAVSLPAYAQLVQQRFLPVNGVRGTVGEPQSYPGVLIDKRLMRLAPGARIFDMSNRSIVHSHLPSGAHVLYAREQSGDIIRVYILTEWEIASLKQAGR
jgi:hypothetical protein